MENLEKIMNNCKRIVKKHPIILSLAAIKAAEVGVLYLIWPEEAHRIYDRTCAVTQEHLPCTAIIASNMQNELIHGLKQIQGAYYLALNQATRTVGYVGNFLR